MRAMAAAQRVGPVLLALALVFVLAGCVKLDVYLTVSGDDTASGTMIVAVAKNVLDLAGQDPDSLYDTIAGRFVAANQPAGASVKTEKYDDGTFTGAKLSLTDVPLADLPNPGATTPNGGGTFTLTHDGDLYHFTAVLDLGAGTTSGVSIPEGVTADADLRVEITFPGEVTETNGTKDGDTARWTPTLGESTQLTATAQATGSSGSGGGGGGTNGLLIVVAVIGGIAVLGAATALLLTRRRELARSTPLVPLPSDTDYPPPLSSLNTRSRRSRLPTPPAAPAPAALPTPLPPPARPLPTPLPPPRPPES
jgi:hypothetical protein